MKITREELKKRLDVISVYRGRPYGRLCALWDAQDGHLDECMKFDGFLALSNAFKCLFLETDEFIYANHPTRIENGISEPYALFVTRLMYNFKSLCGAELLSIRGYPYDAITLLRNTFDNLVLMSAALQNMTDFYCLDGVEVGKPYDPRLSKKLRKNTEYKIRRKMTGDQSGLASTTIDQLDKLNDVFDYEVHGGQLSRIDAEIWMKREVPLPMLPTFKEPPFAMFMNWFFEVTWMAHRLLPLMQLSDAPLNNKWKEKWRIVDETFEYAVKALTVQAGKKVGVAIVEFVNAKFPFDQNSIFSL